jgi:hypothetical protein
VGFFKRLFSADFRAAVAAEAAGDLELAAERYALAGHRDAAVRVHLARADRAGSRADEITALRDALHWSPLGSPARRRVARALGAALLVKCKAEGIATDRDRQRVREAAGLLLEAGDHRAAGEAYELIDDESGAARAYRQGGLLDLMEMALSRGEGRLDRQRELREAFADYELHLQGGARDAAALALRRCVAAADSPAEYRRLLDDLESRLVTGGRLALQLRRGERITVTATPRVSLGRDPLCDVVLRSAGVSRRHAEIEVGAGADAGGSPFAVRDAGSRNGTLLAGLPIEGAVPLDGNGSFALGEDCIIEFTAGRDVLALRIDRGLDRGQRVIVTSEQVVAPLPEIAPTAALRFERGRPILLREGTPVTLNGEPLAVGDIQLLHGDQLRVGACDLEVE